MVPWVWLMDDGCASSDRITFSIHTFVKEEVGKFTNQFPGRFIRGPGWKATE